MWPWAKDLAVLALVFSSVTWEWHTWPILQSSGEDKIKSENTCLEPIKPYRNATYHVLLDVLCKLWAFINYLLLINYESVPNLFFIVEFCSFECSENAYSHSCLKERSDYAEQNAVLDGREPRTQPWPLWWGRRKHPGTAPGGPPLPPQGCQKKGL